MTLLGFKKNLVLVHGHTYNNINVHDIAIEWENSIMSFPSGLRATFKPHLAHNMKENSIPVLNGQNCSHL